MIHYFDINNMQIYPSPQSSPTRGEEGESHLSSPTRRGEGENHLNLFPQEERKVKGKN